MLRPLGSSYGLTMWQSHPISMSPANRPLPKTVQSRQPERSLLCKKHVVTNRGAQSTEFWHKDLSEIEASFKDYVVTARDDFASSQLPAATGEL